MPKTVKARLGGSSVEEQIAAAYERGKVDGAVEERLKFAPDPLYRRDLSELVTHLDSAAVLNRGKGLVLMNFIGEHGVQSVVTPAPVFNLIFAELSRLGYGSRSS